MAPMHGMRVVDISHVIAGPTCGLYLAHQGLWLLQCRALTALGQGRAPGPEMSVAKIVAVMIIIATGLALAFGDTSGGARRMIQIVFGLSIAFAASSFFLSFFSFGGGALV